MFKLVSFSLIATTLCSVSLIANADWSEHHQHEHDNSQISAPQNSQPFNGQTQYEHHEYVNPSMPASQNSHPFNGQEQYEHYEYGNSQNNQQYYGQGQYQHHEYGNQQNTQQYYGPAQSGYAQGYHEFHGSRQRQITIYISGYPYAASYFDPYYYPYAASQIWVESQNGALPPNAIVYQTLNGTSTYYCRVYDSSNIYDGVLIPGDACYVQIDDQWIQYSDYQVLVSLGF